MLALRKRNKLIHGFGINDADYATYQTIAGKEVACPYYTAWHSMLQRQTPKLWEKYPTYTGCKVCEEWRSFMAFRKWMMTQDWVGKHLDKDLLGDDKLYSPETCVFVSQAINKFTTARGADRGEWPIGVNKKGNRFQASCSGAEPRYLGYFDTPEEAHQAWRKAKTLLANELIKTLTCARTVLGLQRYIASI